MSTRCQVQVCQVGVAGGFLSKLTLYHHTYGYTSYLLPLIWKAYHFITPARAAVYKDCPGKLINPGWEHGRVGKAASFLCAASPGVMEPESGHALRGDINYFYKIQLINRVQGSLVEIPIWKVEVFRPTPVFWNVKRPTMSHLERIIPPTDIDKMVTGKGEVLKKFDK